MTDAPDADGEAALLEGRHDIVSVLYGLAAVDSGPDLHLEPAHVDHVLHNGLRLLEPDRVNVHQCDGAVLQCGRQQDIAA